jgi:aminopeptidase N/puromycin-sensitive aminopeptidase
MKFESANEQLWQIPLCLKGSSDENTKCELLTQKEQTFTLPGCSNWVLGNAGATGYYRAGYEPEAVRALAHDAETKLSPGERISLQNDIWASVRVGREPVGDYLAFAQGLQSDRNRAVLEDVLGRLSYIGEYLVNGSDRDSFRAWLRQYLSPIMQEVGWQPKPSDSDEQKTLRSRLLRAMGQDARDPEAIAEARKISDQVLADPGSVDHQLARSALLAAATNGDAAFYDKLMGALKSVKSPEEYYAILFTLPEFTDPKLLERTLEFAVSSEVRSQDALGVVSDVLENEDGQQLAWDFVRKHWSEIEKAGGPFASAQIVGATSNFCDAGMRDQVTEFFNAHKIAAAERRYRQSIERINNCIDLKSQQQTQLASWLGQHGNAGGK